MRLPNNKLTSFKTLQKRLGIHFENDSLLTQALVHPSYKNENPDFELADNQRMEFLGDALINMLVAEKLYHEFPELPEGRLTEIRVSLIRQEKLAEKALTLGLGDYLLLGRGEDSSGGREKRNNLADTFEALVAAIFLDQGIDTTRNFVCRVFDADIQPVKAGYKSPNYKALLQEYTQEQFKMLPEYELMEATGPDHDKLFLIAVSLGELVLAIGSGKTKKLAEVDAAHKAYDKLAVS